MKMIVSIACAAGLMGLSVCAETAAERRTAYLAKGMKTPETSKFFERFEDPQSHVVSYIIRPGLVAHNQQTFYFTTKSMTDDGRFLFFYADADEFDRKVRHRKQLMLIDFLTDTVSPVKDTPPRGLPFADVETDQIWYVKDNGVCRRDLLVDPQKEIRLRDFPKELCPTVSERTHYWANHLTLTTDRRKCFLDSDVSPTGDYYEDSKSRQIMFDLTDGTYEIWGEQDYWVNHGQINPANPRLAMCAYEGCFKKWVRDGKGGRKRVPRPADDVYPRILLVEPGRLTMIPSKITNYATHEHWAEDGKGFYWCSSGAHYCDLATGKQTMICPLCMAHCTLTTDNRYVTGDSPWGGWWRGCGWTTLFWNRETHRGVYIHSKRPVYAPKDKPSNIHPDPHPQFVCGDRYVLCSMNVKEHQLTTSLTPVSELVRLTSVDAQPLAPKRIPLEWNAHNDVSVPYEVTIDCAKLQKAGVVAPPDCVASWVYTAFAVEATADGKSVRIPVEALPGGHPKELILRFRVPAGATALTAIADAPGRFEMRDSVTCDNLFAGALSPAAAPDWTGPREAVVSRHRNGILLEVARQDGNPHVVSYAVDVPAAAAGKPCRLELDVRSLSKMTWPNPIVIRQLDAKGRELPESVIDPRWTSHMRPPEKTCCFREEGRIHPEAKKLRIDFTLRWLTSPYNPHGLKLEDPTDLKPRLLITRLALRSAAVIPFPGYRDEIFPAGVTGEAADSAIRLGRDGGFWYQTRSQASWAEARPMREERQIFYPRADGTAEAYFKPVWPAKSSKAFALFSAVHTGASTETSSYIESRGDIFTLRYTPAAKRLKLDFLDWNDKRFSGETTAEIPSGKWTHVAVTWHPGGEAAVWLDGRKACALSLAGFEPFDLAKSKHPNDAGPVRFHLGFGAGYSPASGPAESDASGAADLLRVSSCVRYAAPFVPPTSFACDAQTRALFTFDRTFDGVSGGGWGFVPGTYLTPTDRRRHELRVGEKTFDYHPPSLPDALNPAKVLRDRNYAVLPTTDDFKTARAVRRVTRTMKAGDVLEVDAPKGVLTDYIEYANAGQVPVAYPQLVGAGEIDPRSFGDIDDTIAFGRRDDWSVCNRLFNLVLSSSDYSQNHLATFHAGSDVPVSVEYEALMMLNAYCGFECGPLNNLAANIFAVSGHCPAAQTAGYGHSFEEVFYGRKNRIYDLSARKFFPALDNEGVADLADADAEPATIGRLSGGGAGGAFVRNGNRGHWVQAPSYQEKVGVVLNPGERFRLWRVHDGEMNDLQLNSCWPGNRRTINRKTCFFKSDAEDLARAKCRKNVKGGRPSGKAPGNTDDDLARLDRFFPESASGYIAFDGRPTADNPAFSDFGGTNFAYRVKSVYPIVYAEYAAETAKGPAPLAISTDFGKTWGALPASADGVTRVEYPVRARHSYLIRAAAPLSAVTRFRAVTTVQANRRLMPGALKAGKNKLTLRSTGAGVANVTVQYRVPDRKIEVKGGFYTGTIPGSERQLVLVTPGTPLVLDVAGASPAAKAEPQGGLKATYAGGKLTLVADAAAKGGYRSPALEPIAAGKPYLTAVKLVDGAAVKELTVLVGANARLLAAASAKLTGGAKLLAADASRANASVSLTGRKQTARFDFPVLPAGKYWILNLTRYASRLEPSSDYWGNRDICLKLPGFSEYPAGAQQSLPDAYMKTTIGSGEPGARGNFKWEYACDRDSYYPYQLPCVFSLPETARVEYFSPVNLPGGVELAAVLILPDPSRDFQRDVRKVLCGYNCEPWTCRGE